MSHTVQNGQSRLPAAPFCVQRAVHGSVTSSRCCRACRGHHLRTPACVPRQGVPGDERLACGTPCGCQPGDGAGGALLVDPAKPGRTQPSLGEGGCGRTCRIFPVSLHIQILNPNPNPHDSESMAISASKAKLGKREAVEVCSRLFPVSLWLKALQVCHLHPQPQISVTCTPPINL